MAADDEEELDHELDSWWDAARGVHDISEDLDVSKRLTSDDRRRLVRRALEIPEDVREEVLVRAAEWGKPLREVKNPGGQIAKRIGMTWRQVRDERRTG